MKQTHNHRVKITPFCLCATTVSCKDIIFKLFSFLRLNLWNGQRNRVRDVLTQRHSVVPFTDYWVPYDSWLMNSLYRFNSFPRVEIELIKSSTVRELLDLFTFFLVLCSRGFCFYKYLFI